MSLKNNIQGQEDTRLEDANSPNSTLRISPTDDNDFPLQGKAVILYKNQSAPNNIILTVDEFYVDDDSYGNLMVPYEFMRIYESDTNKDWIDLKITKVRKSDDVFNDETVIEGIIVRGDYDDVNIGAYIKWSFYIQKKVDNSAPNQIHVGDISSSSATLSWADPTLNKNALMHQVQYRQWGEETWNVSDIGGWIFKTEVALEGARWPAAQSMYFGKNCYWMEFSEPELKNGKKAEGWIEIIDGNFGDIYMTYFGKGYRTEPTVTFYYKKLDSHTIYNFHYKRGVAQSFLTIYETGHNFTNGDEIEISCKCEARFKDKYTVANATGTSFRIYPSNISEFEDDNVIREIKSTLKLTPVPVPLVAGEIKPILSRDKYYITNLNPDSNYEISVMSYFSMDLKDFSEHSVPVNFKTF